MIRSFFFLWESHTKKIFLDVIIILIVCISFNYEIITSNAIKIIVVSDTTE